MERLLRAAEARHRPISAKTLSEDLATLHSALADRGQDED